MGGQAVVWLARLFSLDIRVYAKDTKLLFRKNAGGEGAFGENERTGAGIQTASVFFWFITDFLGIKSFGQAFLKACGFQRQRLWSPTAVGEIPGNTAQLRHTPCLNLIPSAYT